MEAERNVNNEAPAPDITGSHAAAGTGNDTARSTPRKKRHISALVAASRARSAVAHVNKHAYRDVDFAHTGTNLTYKDERGEL